MKLKKGSEVAEIKKDSGDKVKQVNTFTNKKHTVTDPHPCTGMLCTLAGDTRSFFKVL